MQASRVWTGLLALGLAAGAAAAQTTITGTSGGNNSWNQAANWSAGVPAGTIDAIVAASVTARVYDNATPAYTGSLTLNSGATLGIGGGYAHTVVNSLNALGTDGITLNSGSTLTLNMRTNPNPYPPITLAGDATIGHTSNEEHHKSSYFGAVVGPGELTLKGVNNHTTHFQQITSIGGLVVPASGQSWRIEADATGALGTGSVMIGNNVTLQIDALDVIDDDASLMLVGAKDSGRANKLILNADETVGAFLVDGTDQGYGDFTAATHPGSISGSGTLTVPVPNIPDVDGDGFVRADGGFGGDDCNDLDDTIYPGAPELCDGKDNDCDTAVDEGLTCVDTMVNDIGGNISWLGGSNWDLGIPPLAGFAAVVSAGVAAQSDSAATPTYSGGLTIESGASVRAAGSGAAVLGTGPITLSGGSIFLGIGSYSFAQPISIVGNGTVAGGYSTTAHHTTRTFSAPVSGDQLRLNGVNNNTFKLTTANSFDGLFAYSSQNQGWRVEANATGSLGAGDVSIENNVTLLVNAADAMDDGATLLLNGNKDGGRASKLIMNANDTVDALTIDGDPQPSGDYTSASGAWISGGGTLTVALTCSEVEDAVKDAMCEALAGAGTLSRSELQAAVDAAFPVAVAELGLGGPITDMSDADCLTAIAAAVGL